MIYKKDYFLLSLSLLFSILAKGQTTILELRSKADEVFSYRIKPGDQFDSGEYAKTLKNHFNANTGSWVTIDLSDLDDKNCDSNNTDKKWQPIEWLENIRKMAEGVNFVDNTTNEDEEIETAIIDALNDWYSVTAPTNTNCPTCAGSDENEVVTTLPYCCDNWWWNQIGKQFELQRIAILSWDILYADHLATNDNPDLLDNTLLERIIIDLPSSVANINTTDPNDNHTGANKTEIASSMIIKGILRGGLEANETEGLALVGIGKEAMGCAMDFGAEGMQADYSFHQHGALLYSGGYGHSFIEIISTFGAMLQGTDYAFIQDRRNRFYNYILDGYRWMLRGYTTDYSAIGRYISRKQESNSLKVSSDFLDLTVDMLEPNDPDIEDALTYIYMHDDLNSSNDNWQDFDPLGESKHFWKSDYVVHQMPGIVGESTGYLTSVKMCSQRTIGIESINQENKRGYWLPYGCTFLYKRGDEYQNIFPYWDWENVPGVTNPAIWLTPEDGDEPESTTQLSNFVGSAGNERFSVTTMDLDKDYDLDNNNGSPNIKKLEAKKSWFHFGDEIIALGADIQDESGLDVYTTIEQSHYTGSHTKDDNNTEWIQHNDIAYIFPSYPGNPNGSTYMLTTGNQTGSWNEIDSGGETDLEQGNVFKAWINHGTPTTNDPADYYYIIAPGQDAADYAQNNPVTLLKNSAEIQAVRKAEPDGDFVSGAVFYPGFDTLTDAQKRVAITPYTDITVDNPCAVLFDSNTGQICISSPDRAVSSVTLTIFPKAGQPNSSYDVTFDLPDNEEEGTSECKVLFQSALLAINLEHRCGQGFEDRMNNVSLNPFGLKYYEQVSAYKAIFPLDGVDGNIVTQPLDPHKNSPTLQDVNVRDVLSIHDHVSGINPLDGYALVAGDVDRSGTVNYYDAWRILKLLKGNTNSYGFLNGVEAYEFANANFTINSIIINGEIDLDQAGNWNFPQTIEVPAPSMNMIGIKMGDVNCLNTSVYEQAPNDPSPTPFTGDPDCDEFLKIITEDKQLNQGQQFTINLHADTFTNIAAYQFAMRFDTSKVSFTGIQQGDLNRGAKLDNFNLNDASNGYIKTIWTYRDETNQPTITPDTSLSEMASIFSMNFTAIQAISSLSAVISLDTTFYPAAYTDATSCKQKMVLEFVSEGSIRRSEENTSISGIDYLKAYPSPANREITFEMNVLSAGDYNLNIYSVTGQHKITVQRKLSKGLHTFSLDINQWQKGLYYFTVNAADGESHHGKFLKQ